GPRHQLFAGRRQRARRARPPCRHDVRVLRGSFSAARWSVTGQAKLGLILLFLIGVYMAPAAPPARAVVLHSRQEALTLPFPDAERGEARPVTLSEEQAGRVRTLAAAPRESRQVTVYVGYKGGQVLGSAFLDPRVVRPLPAPFLVVLSPAGVVQRVQV